MSEEILTLDSMDYESDVNCAPEQVGGGGTFFNSIIFMPKSGDAPLIGKILPDFRSKDKRANFMIEYHEFAVGAAMTDKRFFYSPRCFGESDALTDLFWKAIKERKNFSDNKESSDYKRWDSIQKMSRPKKGCLLYWIGKGESKVQVLMLKEGAMDVLFGCPAKKDFSTGGDIPPIPGLVKEMREVGESPFNLKSSTGWVKLYKTGMALSTVFHADLDQVKKEEIVNGKRRILLESAEAAVDAAILELDANSIPDFKVLTKEKSWTANEIEDYINSDFTVIPERFYPKKRVYPGSLERKQDEAIGGAEVESAVNKAYSGSVGNVNYSQEVGEDDIPF